MLEKKTKQFESGRNGSALIMTMVLTVLLAIIAVMFVAVARMDRASTSNIADNKSLDLAAKSITEIISKDLILDTPGAAAYDPNKYYDYPDANNPWLASLEPYIISGKSPDDSNSGVCRWRQISDVTGYLKNNGFEVNDVNVKPAGSKVIKEYPDITLNPNGTIKNSDVWADADGDGIADSKWIELKDSACLRSSKGQKIYAAVRVIDNGGMININTADKFDVNSIDANAINGSSQMQINLKGLLKGTDTITRLHQVRCGSDSNTWSKYEKNVIWDYNSVPGGNYLPFDISDELELRYRYCIDSKFVSRFEVNMPYTAEGAGTRNFGILYDGSTSSPPTNTCASNWGLRDWQRRMTEFDDCKSDRRHLLTAYNLDRVIDPCGVKMANINDANVNTLYKKIRSVIPDGNTAAQIAVNIIDYRDTDSNVTVFPKNGKKYYGFEQPCVYISELMCRQVTDGTTGLKYKSYAIELFKPFIADINPNSTWNIFINAGGTPIPISNWTVSSQYYVITWNDPGAPLDDIIFPGTPTFDWFGNPVFKSGDTISLTRHVDVNDIVVDYVVVPPVDVNFSVQRETTPSKCMRRLWKDPRGPNETPPTLGEGSGWRSADANTIQAHPKNGPFTNVGEIGMILRKPAYYIFGEPNTGVIGYNSLNNMESQVRLNLADPNYQKLFKYLTVWPRSYALGPNAEIKGRININTAPAYVIAQLPWVSRRKTPLGYNDANLARAIVAYRDKLIASNGITNGPDYSSRSGNPGFRTIGELCDVNRAGYPDYGIDYYSRKDGPKTGNQLGFPDLTPDDAADDFEERDLIFTRISDLVTVRSDIFTAYILVRIGTDGPQKRYMVILDRSNVPADSNGPKKIVFQQVPQAR
jgi:hypothetical protein